MGMNAIRVAVTDDIRTALDKAKAIYPTLSDAEILKVGLARIVREEAYTERGLIRHAAAHAVGDDYLADEAEDTYTEEDGEKVTFA
jgi:hypothetical protein